MYLRILLVTSLLLTGCATSPVSQQAELLLEPLPRSEPGWYVLLDDKPLTGLSSVYVSPGRHSIAADCGMIWTPTRPRISYQFKAATRYRFSCDGRSPKVIPVE